jgi:hypothetical protein
MNAAVSSAREQPLTPARTRRSGTAIAALFFLLTAQAACLPKSYEIPRTELARLSAVPPVLRGIKVEVEQELSGSVVEPAPPVGDTTVVVTGGVSVGSSLPHSRPSGEGGGFGGVNLGKGGAGADAKATAIAILMLATFGLVIATAIESQRYAGTVQLHPMHPVHLFGRDGNYLVRPLATIDAATVQWTERAVIRAAEGPVRMLERAPLRRRGLTYSMSFGVSQLASADGTHTSGPHGYLQFGYFPTQTVGLLATASYAWRDNLVFYTLYEQRYGAELQVMPFHADIFHIGAYAGGGMAWRIEDGFLRGNDRSTSLSAGLQAQLDVATHVAVTARFGLYTAHEQSIDEPMREVSIGLSVY